MRQFTLGYFLLFACCLSVINAGALRKNIKNRTTLFGQILAPPGGAARNLKNLILSINVAFSKKVLHTSITPITYGLFPVDYSVEIDEREITLQHIPHFEIIAAIWQPAYVHESTVKIPTEDVESLNLTMRAINFVIIRGEIIHDKHARGHDLPGVHVKLELVKEGDEGSIIDQVDFIGASKTYPCPFEYWLDTSRIHADATFKLEATLSAHRLLSRKSIGQPHKSHLAATKASSSTPFKINPMTNTEINNYTIVLVDVE